METEQRKKEMKMEKEDEEGEIKRNYWKYLLIGSSIVNVCCLKCVFPYGWWMYTVTFVTESKMEESLCLLGFSYKFVLLCMLLVHWLNDGDWL
jgi:hypothetical protein